MCIVLSAPTPQASPVQRRALAPNPHRFSLTLERTDVRCTAWQLSPERSAAFRIVASRRRPPRRRAQRFLTTVLITDIVDSTGMAIRLGDRRWRELLADHYAACRAEIERRGGELVSTTGDGVVAIFDGPARAVRAGIAMQGAASAAGIALRVGLHAGECERLGEDVAGIAVHIAARVCALGGAGEVVTTGTVRDLAIGSTLAFEPHGSHELKGVPERWPLFHAADQ